MVQDEADKCRDMHICLCHSANGRFTKVGELRNWINAAINYGLNIHTEKTEVKQITRNGKNS